MNRLLLSLSSSTVKLSSRGLTQGVEPAGSSWSRDASDPAVKPRDDHCIARADDKRRVRGFTLLEVMIALLVITIGLGAVINTTSESGWKSAQLKQSTIASWVAQNELARYRAKRIWNDASRQSGKAEMANAEWTWELKISKTDDPSLRRLDIEVFLEGEEAVKARLTGFIALL